MAFNNLTDAQAERLAILIEELGEAAQAAGKILRHGYASYNPDDPTSLDNKHNLEKELGDVRFAVHLLGQNGDISEGRVITRVGAKEKSIQKYLHHTALY